MITHAQQPIFVEENVDDQGREEIDDLNQNESKLIKKLPCPKEKI